MNDHDEASSQVTRRRTFDWDDPMITASAVGHRSGIDLLRDVIEGKLPQPPIAATLGFTLTSAEPGHVVFALDPAEYHYNPIGSVHGGIFATLLDSATGCAVHSMLPMGVGYTSLDLAVKYLRAVKLDTGRITCTGTVTHLGRRTALAEAQITGQDGKLFATGTSSCLLLRG